MVILLFAREMPAAASDPWASSSNAMRRTRAPPVGSPVLNATSAKLSSMSVRCRLCAAIRLMALSWAWVSNRPGVARELANELNDDIGVRN